MHNPSNQSRHTTDIRKIASAGILALATTAVLAACGSASHPAAPATHAPPAATQPAPAATQAATQAPALPAGCGQMKAWDDSDPQQALTGGIDSLDTATSAANPTLAAVESDGLNLVGDAQLAASYPPPIDPADYIAAMSFYRQAGAAIEAGNFATGGPLIGQATVHINALTAAVSAACGS
jgi:hypothetical protein